MASTVYTDVDQIPVFLFIVAMMCISLFGNGVTCFIYGYKLRQTVTRNFIFTLSMLDLMSSVICMPIEIYIVAEITTFKYSELCKFSRYITYVSHSATSLVLLAIALDRYYKVCRPLQPFFNVRTSRIYCSIAILFSFVLAWPSIVLYGTNSIPEINGTTCSISEDMATTSYPLIFYILYTSCFLFVALSMSIIYVRIIKQMRLLKQKQNLRRSRETIRQSPNNAEDGPNVGQDESTTTGDHITKRTNEKDGDIGGRQLRSVEGTRRLSRPMRLPTEDNITSDVSGPDNSLDSPPISEDSGTITDDQASGNMTDHSHCRQNNKSHPEDLPSYSDCDPIDFARRSLNSDCEPTHSKELPSNFECSASHSPKHPSYFAHTTKDSSERPPYFERSTSHSSERSAGQSGKLQSTSDSSNSESMESHSKDHPSNSECRVSHSSKHQPYSERRADHSVQLPSNSKNSSSNSEEPPPDSERSASHSARRPSNSELSASNSMEPWSDFVSTSDDPAQVVGTLVQAKTYGTGSGVGSPDDNEIPGTMRKINKGVRRLSDKILRRDSSKKANKKQKQSVRIGTIPIILVDQVDGEPEVESETTQKCEPMCAINHLFIHDDPSSTQVESETSGHGTLTDSEDERNIEASNTRFSFSRKNKIPKMDSLDVPQQQADSQKNNSRSTRFKSIYKPGKTTRMLLTVTILFFTSFLPFFIIVILRTRLGVEFFFTLNHAEFVAVGIFIRSYLVSNASNPIIYGFLNDNFRNQVKKLLKGKLRRTPTTSRFRPNSSRFIR
ncbi:hypothetical protein SNE40_011148 [Patella caerulea]|uniref:G-protein coupled receptors family 1 profile domain-containing protein n=1 Tax=Patella caerulea TaxID=87958 RepID=A0AAN8JZV1_PATCE